MGSQLLLKGCKWVFRGYNTLDDFVNNTNCLYKSYDCPKKNQGKYVYILSKYFFDPYVGKNYWNRFEDSNQFDDVTFIYEDHEESVNVDYRWFEVMRKRRRGIYILDQTPRCYNQSPDTDSAPILVPGHFILYDKYEGKPFSIYGFTDPNSIYREFPDRERDMDVSYVGAKRTQRKDYIKAIERAASKLGLKYHIDTGSVSEHKYLDILRRSKIAYNFIGVGYRTGREFECMVNGSMLINDDRTVNHMITPGIKCGIDFIKFDPCDVVGQMGYWLSNEKERLVIAKSGFKAIWNIWDGCTDPYQSSRRLASKYISEKKW